MYLYLKYTNLYIHFFIQNCDMCSDEDHDEEEDGEDKDDESLKNHDDCGIEDGVSDENDPEEEDFEYVDDQD